MSTVMTPGGRNTVLRGQSHMGTHISSLFTTRENGL
jgi:hypothetical protein